VADVRRDPPSGHHSVTSTKLNKISPNFVQFSNRPAFSALQANLEYLLICFVAFNRPAFSALQANLEYLLICFVALPFPSLAEQTHLHSGSEEVRSSILVGSAKFSDIFFYVSFGFRGMRPPLTGPVSLCEEVRGHHRVTGIM
jgi:hypothetical protein